MDKANDIISFEGKIFSEEEFRTLRSEQDMRIKMVFSNGYTLAGIILVFWAALFTLCKDLIEIANANNSLIGKSALMDCAITLGIVVFCSIPALLAFAFSIKYHDNIRQIVSIANYIRVYHEYPSMIRKTQNTDEKKCGIFGWEVLHCNHEIPNGKFIAYEYGIIAIASLIMSMLLGGALFACVWGIPIGGQLPAYREGHAALTVIIISVIIGILYILFVLVLVVCCIKNISVDKLFAKYGSIYFDEYVEHAVAVGLITEHEKEILKNNMNSMHKRDSEIHCKLKNKKNN